ncbi:nitroreductase family protein [Paenibacillus chitinolyticus]|uniref:nitroreductase family protein n=1 Tax=Paenibacillus chitinolyticus TaxID=79263 RepID=UPI002DB5EB81|nr:nitroreductase family protein [Paenibacillus chitinolyticus]MEC0247688.1 nitroreductase family protein [Paenibacillus chitinolyticus]
MTQQLFPETLKVIAERHSVKSYDPDFVFPEDHKELILNAANQAPSSWNLQHWKFLVIDDPAAKQRLLPIANNQKQVAESSFVVAVLGDLQANLNAETIYGAAVESGFLTPEIKDTLVSQINGAYASGGSIPRDEAIRNASFASMQLMLAAKALGYDTCPMGGFNPAAFVQEFNVPERYIPTLLISVGKAAKPAYASGRFPLEQVVVKNSF